MIWAVIAGLALGMFCDRLVLAHSQSRATRDRRSVQKYTETRHWPAGYGSDEQWEQMAAQDDLMGGV